MRLQKNLKANKVKVSVENADDLWVLKGVIEPGNVVRGSTERKIKIGGTDEKAKVTRKRMFLTITVEKVEYDGSSLRVLGAIVDGPEDIARGEHHSFGLEPGEEIEIIREWPHYLLSKLNEATKEDSSLLVVLFDREEAKLYAVTRRGVEELTRLKGKVAKKDFESKVENFYKEIVQVVRDYDSRYKYAHIVAGAPAFWKEYLQKELPDDLKKKTVLTTISAVEKTAIRELLSRPEVAKLLRKSATMRELALVEDVMEALGNEKLAYGIKAVKEVVNLGNCSKVIVSEKTIANAREKEDRTIEKLLQTAEQTKGEVHVISDDDAMQRIDDLGGIVAVKRW